MQYGRSYILNHRFALGILLNSIFVLVELFYGFRANSVALIADAVHNAADVFGLCLIWFSYIMAQHKAPHKFTYGYKNATIFSAFINTIVIFAAVGNLIWVSIERFSSPADVTSKTMIVVAAVGVLINGLTALLFMKDRHKDINMLGIYINMAMDAAVSLTVVIAGVFIWWKQLYWLDPTMGLVIAVTILLSSWGLFKESINLIFQAVPSSIDLAEIKQDLQLVPDVLSYHDLHVWPLSTTETALSVHIVVKSVSFKFDIIHNLSTHLVDKYGIHHSTIQLEIEGNSESCQLDC